MSDPKINPYEESDREARLADYLAGEMTPSEAESFLRKAKENPSLVEEIASLNRAREAIGMLRADPDRASRTDAFSIAAAPQKTAAAKRLILAAALAASLLLAFFAGFQAGSRAAAPASASLDPSSDSFEAAFGKAYGDLSDHHGLARSWIAFSRAMAGR